MTDLRKTAHQKGKDRLEDFFFLEEAFFKGRKVVKKNGYWVYETGEALKATTDILDVRNWSRV